MIRLYDLSLGTYNGVTEDTRENYMVEYKEGILNNHNFIHEWLDVKDRYKFFCDYDENKKTKEEVIEVIKEYFKSKNLELKSIEVAEKSTGDRKYHIVIEDYNGTVKVIKRFFEGMDLKLDMGVYRRGFFRMPNQYKPECNGKCMEISYYKVKEGLNPEIFILGNIREDSKEIIIDDRDNIILREGNIIIKELDKSKDEISILPKKDKIELDKLKENVKNILNNLSNNRVDDYNNWIEIGMIIKNEIGDEGFDIWYKWSEKSEKFNSSEIFKKWTSFNYNGSLGIGSLMRYLKEDNEEIYRELVSYKRTNVEEMIMKIVRNEEDSHIKLAELYKLVNPDKFVIGMQKGDIEYLYYYYDDISGRILLDSSNTEYMRGVKNIIEEIDKIIDFKEKTYKNKIEKEDETSVKKLKIQKEELKILKRIRKNLGSKSTYMAIKDTIVPLYWRDNIIDKIDSQHNLLGFEDGVYDLDEGEFRKAKPEEYVSMTTKYNYPQANEEIQTEIKKILKEMFKTEEDYESLLFELSYGLHGYKKYDIISIWTGRGGNGKSILMEILKQGLGEYYEELSSGYFTNYDEKSSAPCPELLALKGVRIVNTNEIGCEQKLLINKLKKITTSIDGRNLFKKGKITFKPQFLSILQANDLPMLSRVDDAIERRMNIRRFPYCFRSENLMNLPEIKIYNPNLQRDIYEKKYGEQLILILIDYYKKKVRDSRKFMQSESIKEETRIYLEESNPVLIWLKENYEITNDENDKISSTILYQFFKNETNKEISSQLFGRYMTSMNIRKKKTTNTIFYTNIKIKPKF
jgi:phage/plasmid-associated DNA primase